MRPQKASTVPMSIAGVILFCGVFVLFASILSHLFVPSLGWDQNSYLLEAQRMLSGAELYGSRIQETNPPLIIWFSAVPVAAAGWFHSSPGLLVKLLVLGMIFLSTAWCVRILRLSQTLTNPLAIALLGLAVFGCELVFEEIQFGQREHLFVILAMPYILAAATGVISRLPVAERCGLGIAAGFAVWFKPQHTLDLIGLELFLVLKTRRLRRLIAPEVLSLAFTGAFLLAMVRIFAPLYISQTYPILADTYWALGGSTTFHTWIDIHRLLLSMLVVLMIYLFTRRSLRDRYTFPAVLVTSVFATFAFALGNNIWGYHRIPHRSFFLLSIAYLAVDLVYPLLVKLSSDTGLIRRLLYIGAAVTAVLLLAVAIHPRLAHFARRKPGDQFNRFLGQYPPNTTAYIFSVGVEDFSDVYLHHMEWGSRFIHLWMLPALIQNETGPPNAVAPFKRLPPERLAELSNLLRSDVVEDLSTWRPTLVLVRHCTIDDPCPGLRGKNLDMISWFKRSPEFAAAFSSYQQQPGLEKYDVYTLRSNPPQNSVSSSASEGTVH